MIGLKSFVIGIFGISLVIAVHEFGHWSFANIFNVKTPQFSVGFGPTILKKRLGETEFSISAFPIGGFVEIYGMRHPNKEEARAFFSKPYYQKLFILLGGVIFNLLFAILIFFLIGSPARFVQRRIITGEIESIEGSEQGVVGPIGIIRMAAKSASQGISFFLFFLAILSINLAFINLVPLPIFDGGQIVIYTTEALIGKTLSAGLYNMIMTITTVIVIIIFLRITTKDIKRSFGR